MMNADDFVPFILGFIGLVAGIVVTASLWTFINGTRKRWRQCGSLWRALTESHVNPSLGEFEVKVFGSQSAVLRVFTAEDGAGLAFEIRPRGLFAYARHEYPIMAKDLQPLAQALRRAATGE